MTRPKDSGKADKAPTPAKATERSEPKRDPRACVVNDGTCVGRAVNGKVCSAHAVSHKSDGTPR